MGLSRSMLCAAASVTALLVATPALAKSVPQSVTIPLTTREGESFPNVVTVSVGGGRASPVTFDTGSAGLYLLGDAIGSYIDTGATFIQTYEDHNQFTGKVVLATVSFPDASGVATTGMIGVGFITDAGCKPGFSCPGMGTGRVGVLGARYYNSAADNVFNPLAFLPGNLNSGFIVAAGGPTPSLIVGLTPEMTAPFLSNSATVFIPESTAGQGGAPYAWETKSISICFSVNGAAKSCAATSLDTGEHDAQFVPGAPVDPKLIDNKDYLKPDQSVTISIPGLLSTTVTTGNTNWLNRYKLVPAPIGNPPGFNSGAQFYYYYAVAFDYLNGTAGFSPLTTWITGNYTASRDSDLGNPGAIAIFGTLNFEDGFVSSRPIFIASDSTFNVIGDATLSGTLSGANPLTIEGQGTLTLDGQSVNTAPVLINGPTVYVDGSLPTVVVLADGKIGGIGSIGALVADTGIIAPGHSIGTFTVTGDAVFGPGAVYEAEIGKRGRNDLVAVGGRALIAGGTLTILPDETFTPHFGKHKVLTAAGGIDGEFRVEASHFGASKAAFPFIGIDAVTTANAVIVELGRSDVPFAQFAQTPNQRAAASGADRLPWSDPLLQALAFLNGPNAPAAFDAISGEIYASDQTVLIQQADIVRYAVMGRLRQISDGAVRPDTPLYLWGEGYGGFADNDGNFNVGGVDSAIGGFLTGFDAKIAPEWRLGLAMGAGWSNFDLDVRRSSGSADNLDLAVYANGNLGAAGPGLVTARLGGAHSWHDIDTDRSVLFPGFADRVSASYDASTAQMFGELGYQLACDGLAQLEPFVGLGYANLDTDSFRERGGVAALRGRGDDFSSTESVLGVRAARLFSLANGHTVRLQGEPRLWRPDPDCRPSVCRRNHPVHR